MSLLQKNYRTHGSQYFKKCCIITLFLAVFFSFSHAPGFAGPGHDHGTPEPKVDRAISPRAYMQDDIFEIVAIKTDQKLIVFLANNKTNAPVSGALLDVFVERESFTIKEIALGVYSADWDPSAGQKDLAFVISVDGSERLLNGSIRVPETDELQKNLNTEASLVDKIFSTQTLISFFLGGILVFLVSILRSRRAIKNSEQTASENNWNEPLPKSEDAARHEKTSEIEESETSQIETSNLTCKD